MEGTPVGTPSKTDVSAVENDVDAQPTTTSPTSESVTDSPEPSLSSSTDDTTEALPEHPLRVLSLSNFEKALKEITPSSSESLGTLSELRKWNDEFGEGKREKRRNMWGKGSFGFVEKGEGQNEIKIAASAGGEPSSA